MLSSHVPELQWPDQKPSACEDHATMELMSTKSRSFSPCFVHISWFYSLASQWMLHISMFLKHFSHLGLFWNSVPTTSFCSPQKDSFPAFCWVSIKCRQNKIPVHFEQKSRCLQFVSVLFQLTWDSGNMELHTSHLVAPNTKSKSLVCFGMHLPYI